MMWQADKQMINVLLVVGWEPIPLIAYMKTGCQKAINHSVC